MVAKLGFLLLPQVTVFADQNLQQECAAWSRGYAHCRGRRAAALRYFTLLALPGRRAHCRAAEPIAGPPSPLLGRRAPTTGGSCLAAYPRFFQVA